MNSPDTGYPAIVITVSEDQFRVYLSLVAGGSSPKDLKPETVLNELEKQGIVAGIQKEAVESAVSKWNRNKKSVEKVLVAQSFKAEDVKMDLKGALAVRGVTELESLTKIRKLDFKHSFYVDEFCNADRVDAGTVIIEPVLEDENFDGKTVYGNKIDPSQIAVQLIERGDGVGLNSSGSHLIASQTGVVAWFNHKIEVIPVIFDGHVEIELDDPRMHATASFYPHHASGNPLTLESIKKKLAELGVKAGVDEELILKCIQKSVDRSEKVTEVIAKGEQPTHGKDGWVEHLLDFTASLKPQIKEDGSADFKNLSLIKPVKPGTPLARYHKATRGEDGMDIRGEKLPARDGNDTEMMTGINTERSQDDPDLLVASVSGNARLTGNTVEVSECYVVEGDVDFSTGNINYPKTVVIQKDVKSTFSVDVGGDLEVNGIVEEAHLKAHGNILVKAGFLGNGEGLIESDSDVAIGFIRNQTVKCRKNLVISGEAINSKLMSRRNIDVGGKTLGIVGGIARARNEIICESAGNESGTKTELHVGFDFALLEEKNKTDAKLRELTSNKNKLDPHLNKLLRLKTLKKNLAPNESALLKKLVDMQSKIKSQIKALEERRELIQNKLKEIGSSKITIKSVIYPGVVLYIGDAHLQINRKREGNHVYTLKDGEIKGS